MLLVFTPTICAEVAIQLYGAKGSIFKVYFIHLSTGEYWLSNNGGGLRKAVNDAVTPEAHTFTIYDSYSGNTDQREWPGRFNKNDWKNYDIVMFKSCFPASHIDSKGMLKEYKNVYRKKMMSHFKQNPGILFIIVTAPPLVPNETDQQSADRARTFNNWLKGAFLRKYNKKNPGHKNLVVFDYFDILADASDPNRNMLNKEYRTSAWDSHPNRKGQRKATKKFIPFLKTVTDNWAAPK